MMFTMMVMTKRSVGDDQRYCGGGERDGSVVVAE